MHVYLRLLGWLRPYSSRLWAAVLCMVVYALASAVSLGLVAPFMKILFERGVGGSLAATRLPDVLEPTAFADDGEVMAVRHRELPAVGVQFHPESVLTPDGPALARNFLEGRL